MDDQGRMGAGRFDGKVALVTGAGSGIGRAVALRLAVEGARVLAVDVNAATLEETAGLAGEAVSTRVADVRDPVECGAIVAECVERLGRLDVLGNIAGIVGIHHVTDVTVEEYRRLMGVNVDACFFLSQAAIPHLLETGGNIVNIASNAGLMGQAYTVVYCMTKGAIVQLTRALAMELVKTSVRVNAIAPAGTNTAIAAAVEWPADLDPELMKPYTGFRGLAEPEEIAALFAHVASSDGRSVHGAVLSVDNGVTAG